MIIAYSTFGVSFLIVQPMAFYNFFRKIKEVPSFNKLVYEYQSKEIEKINSSVNPRLEFFTFEGHYWLEVRILSNNGRYEDRVRDELDDSSSVLVSPKQVRLDSVPT